MGRSTTRPHAESGHLIKIVNLRNLFQLFFNSNVRVTDKKAAQDDADVQAAVKKVTEELGDTGRILVRESGTEPVVRVMVEAESEEICQKYVDMVVNVIKKNGYVAG